MSPKFHVVASSLFQDFLLHSSIESPCSWSSRGSLPALMDVFDMENMENHLLGKQAPVTWE